MFRVRVIARVVRGSGGQSEEEREGWRLGQYGGLWLPGALAVTAGLSW